MPRAPPRESISYASKREAAWQSHYKRLCEFQREFGHTRVNLRYEKDLVLGSWVDRQRRYEKALRLKPHRKKLLDRIGFVWDARRLDAVWNESFEKLVAFQQEYGHTQVTRSYSKDVALAHWVSHQREAVRKGEKTMTQARIQKLNEIGFVWNHRLPQSEASVAGSHGESESESSDEDDPDEQRVPNSPTHGATKLLLDGDDSGSELFDDTEDEGGDNLDSVDGDEDRAKSFNDESSNSSEEESDYEDEEEFRRTNDNAVPNRISTTKKEKAGTPAASKAGPAASVDDASNPKTQQKKQRVGKVAAVKAAPGASVVNASTPNKQQKKQRVGKVAAVKAGPGASVGGASTRNEQQERQRIDQVLGWLQDKLPLVDTIRLADYSVRMVEEGLDSVPLLDDMLLDRDNLDDNLVSIGMLPYHRKLLSRHKKNRQGSRKSGIRG